MKRPTGPFGPYPLDPQIVTLKGRTGREGPAWFTTDEAPGALPNGTRVQKVRDDPSDKHKPGDLATVLGSIGPIPFGGRPAVICYFVEWDDSPGIPVAIIDDAVKPTEPEAP